MLFLQEAVEDVAGFVFLWCCGREVGDAGYDCADAGEGLSLGEGGDVDEGRAVAAGVAFGDYG